MASGWGPIYKRVQPAGRRAWIRPSRHRSWHPAGFGESFPQAWLRAAADPPALPASFAEGPGAWLEMQLFPVSAAVLSGASSPPLLPLFLQTPGEQDQPGHNELVAPTLPGGGQLCRYLVSYCPRSR